MRNDSKMLAGAHLQRAVLLNGRMELFETRFSHGMEMMNARLNNLEQRQAEEMARLTALTASVVNLTTSAGQILAARAAYALILDMKCLHLHAEWAFFICPRRLV